MLQKFDHLHKVPEESARMIESIGLSRKFRFFLLDLLLGGLIGLWLGHLFKVSYVESEQDILHQLLDFPHKRDNRLCIVVQFFNASEMLEQLDQRRMQFLILILQFLLLEQLPLQQLDEERLEEDFVQRDKDFDDEQNNLRLGKDKSDTVLDLEVLGKHLASVQLDQIRKLLVDDAKFVSDKLLK